jgi:hypothetical protein
MNEPMLFEDMNAPSVSTTQIYVARCVECGVVRGGAVIMLDDVAYMRGVTKDVARWQRDRTLKVSIEPTCTIGGDHKPTCAIGRLAR